MSPGVALNSNILSTFLFSLGIRNLHVHFDSTNKRIDAAYEQYGQHHERKITFQEIEQLFYGSDSTHEAGPTSPANDPEGSRL